jgi:chromosomal replication initiation ATPase DnaA
VVELGDPDRETRRGMLERHFARHGIGPDNALTDYLADRPVDSGRTLMTLVQRVATVAAERAVPLSAGLAREVLEGPERGRRAGGLRTSGLVVSTAGGIRSREKIVWDWPDQADRLLEELR